MLMLVTIAFIPLVFSVFPDFFTKISHYLGVEFPFVIMFGFIFLFTYLLMHSVLLRLYRIENNLRKLSQFEALKSIDRK